MDDTDDVDVGLAGLSQEFQDMVGGLAGHTASFARLLEKRSSMSRAAAKKKDDEIYLESYADLEIHEQMLKDEPRMEAYRRAIEACAPAWRQSGDTEVIDVGSGTGLLAVCSARAGAKRVHAIEASRLAHYCRQIVEANSLASAVHVHECKAEDFSLDHGHQVDVIVSEWMGYFLLFENMLPSVLSVRDRYLKPGGQMLPSKCRLMLAPLEDREWRDSKIEFWKDVAGIDMSSLVPLAAATACKQPKHKNVPVDGLLASATDILEMDLHSVQQSDLRSFTADVSFELPAGRRLDGFASWFECEFGEAGWLLSTSPSAPSTHWRQTAFYLRKPMEVGGSGLTIQGSVNVEILEDFTRGYRVTFDFTAPGRESRLETYELR